MQFPEWKLSGACQGSGELAVGDGSRRDTVGCVLAGELDAQRAAVNAWHRRSTVLWGTAAGLATGTVIALVLETKRERRNATLGVAASTRGARATLRVRF